MLHHTWPITRLMPLHLIFKECALGPKSMAFGITTWCRRDLEYNSSCYDVGLMWHWSSHIDAALWKKKSVTDRGVTSEISEQWKLCMRVPDEEKALNCHYCHCDDDSVHLGCSLLLVSKSLRHFCCCLDLGEDGVSCILADHELAERLMVTWFPDPLACTPEVLPFQMCTSILGFSAVLGLKPRGLCTLDKTSANRATPLASLG